MKLIIQLLLIFLLTTATSFAQNCASFKNGQVESGIIKRSKGINEKIISKNIAIVLGGGFDDTVIVYVNQKKVFDGYLKTNFSTGVTDKTIIIEPKTLRKNNILHIISLKNNECMIAAIKTSYKVLYVDKYKKWYLNYTNYRIWLE